MKLRRTVMRNHCRRMAEQERERTRGAKFGRRGKRAAFAAAWARMGSPNIRRRTLKGPRIARYQEFNTGW